MPFKLQEGEVRIISLSQCQSYFDMKTITPRMLCAGYDAGTVDSCMVMKGSIISIGFSSERNFTFGTWNDLNEDFGAFLSKCNLVSLWKSKRFDSVAMLSGVKVRVGVTPQTFQPRLGLGGILPLFCLDLRPFWAQTLKVLMHFVHALACPGFQWSHL